MVQVRIHNVAQGRRVDSWEWFWIEQECNWDGKMFVQGLGLVRYGLWQVADLGGVLFILGHAKCALDFPGPRKGQSVGNVRPSTLSLSLSWDCGRSRGRSRTGKQLILGASQRAAQVDSRKSSAGRKKKKDLPRGKVCGIAAKAEGVEVGALRSS